MADINHVITLGIGMPAGIPEFLTLGLQIGEEAVFTPIVFESTVKMRRTALSTIEMRQATASTTKMRRTATANVEIA